jgi:hypothetical protein
VKIKVEPTGLLLILTGITAEGPVVGFIGAQTLKQLSDKLYSDESRNSVKWRADHYAIDNLEKKK